MRPRSLTFALVSALALSCGQAAPTAPSDAATRKTEATATLPETSPESGAAPRDAGVDVERDAHADLAADAVAPPMRDAVAQPVEAAVAGPCGDPPEPACPATYVGTSVIMGPSGTGFTAALAPDDTLYLGGSFDDTTDFDPTAGLDVRMRQGYSDAFITELGPTGSYVGTSTFPGSDYWGAGVWSLSATTDSVVALGGFNGTIDLDPGPGVDMHETAQSGSGTFAVKVTAAGAFVWGRALTSDSNGGAYWSHVAAAPDGTAYLGGDYEGVVDLDPGPGTRTAPTAMGVFLMRLDDQGGLAWVRTLGGDACTDAEVDGVALGADGAPWFVGVFQGTCAFDQSGRADAGAAPADAGAAQADSGMFIASMTTDGQVRGLWTIAGGFSVSGMSTAPDGSVYTAGTVTSTVPGQDTIVDFDPSAAMAARTVSSDSGSNFVLKLDQTGVFRWVQILSDDLPVTAIAATPDDGVLVAGGPHALPVGMFILKLDADQHEVWRLFAGGGSTDPSAVLVGAKEFVVAGTQTTPGDLDPSASVDRFEGTLSFVSRYTF
jgi:hypothetical protein